MIVVSKFLVDTSVKHRREVEYLEYLKRENGEHLGVGLINRIPYVKIESESTEMEDKYEMAFVAIPIEQWKKFYEDIITTLNSFPELQKKFSRLIYELEK